MGGRIGTSQAMRYLSVLSSLRIFVSIGNNGDVVGAVGVELKAMLKTRKLLIPLNEKSAKNTELAQVRYTPGTRSLPEQSSEVGT